MAVRSHDHYGHERHKLKGMGDIVLATEEACTDLDEEKAAGLRSEVAKTVKWSKPCRSNICSEERKVLLDLKFNKNVRILPEDKGKATAILHTSDYQKKLNTLLSDSSVYEVLNKDPTTTYKNKLLKILTGWKKDSMSDTLYYPRKFYCLQTRSSTQTYSVEHWEYHSQDR